MSAYRSAYESPNVTETNPDPGHDLSAYPFARPSCRMLPARRETFGDARGAVLKRVIKHPAVQQAGARALGVRSPRRPSCSPVRAYAGADGMESLSLTDTFGLMLLERWPPARRSPLFR